MRQPPSSLHNPQAETFAPRRRRSRRPATPSTWMLWAMVVFWVSVSALSLGISLGWIG
jgi:hypothetical protein